MPRFKWPCIGKKGAGGVVVTVPLAPTLTLATGGDGTVSVAFTDNGNGGSTILSHNVYRGTVAGGETYVGNLTGSSPFLDTGLINGTQLFYKFTAVNAVGESLKSNEVSATPVAAVVGAVSYAQGMGETDTNGYVKKFPLRMDAGSTARRIWADAVNGDDSNNGLSPWQGYRLNGTGTYFQYNATGKDTVNSGTGYGPVKTLLRAMQLIPSQNDNATPVDYVGEGHQIFLCQGAGQTFTDPNINNGFQQRMGYNAQYPICLQSYDPADPLNESTHGRALVDRPRINLLISNVDSSIGFLQFIQQRQRRRHSYAFRGIFFGSVGDSPNLLGVGGASNVLWENCYFNIIHNPTDAGTFLIRNIIVRRNVFNGHYGTVNGINAGSYHSGGAMELYFEDNIVAWSGWNHAGYRNNSKTDGGADFFKHGWYGSVWAPDQIRGRRNVFIGCSATGLSSRNQSYQTDNVTLFCPISATTSGSSVDSQVENANGALSFLMRNITLGADECLGYYSFVLNGVPTVGKTITVGGVAWTFIPNGATPAGNQIAVGTDALSSAQAIAAAIAPSNPSSKWKGYVQTYGVQTTGTHVYQQPLKLGSRAVVLSTNDPTISINGDDGRTTGFGVGCTRFGSFLRYNFLANSLRKDDNTTLIGLSKDTAPDLTIRLAVDYNSNYAYATNIQALPAGSTVVFDYGSHNINSATSPYTNEQIFADVGYTTQEDMFADMMAHPEYNWSARFQASITKLFGHQFPVSSDARPKMLTPPSLTSSGDINAPTTGDVLTYTPPTFDIGTTIIQWGGGSASGKKAGGPYPVLNQLNQTTYTISQRDSGIVFGVGGMAINGEADSTTFPYLELGATPTGKPYPPRSSYDFSNLTPVAVAGSGQVTVQFANIELNTPGASSNTLYGSTTSGFTLGPGNLLKNFTTGTNTVVTGLAAGKWYFRLTATNALGEGDPSPEFSATVINVPSAPTIGSITGTSTTLYVPFTDGATNGAAITGHKVYASMTSGFTPGAGNLLGTYGTSSPISLTGLASGMTYYLRMSAVNSAGEGAFSAEATGATTAVANAPNAPSGLAVTRPQGQTRQLQVSFTDGSNNGSAITSHNAYVSTMTGFTPSSSNLYGSYGATSPIVITNLTSGTQYYIRLTAVNANGESGYSEETTGTPS